MKVKVSKELRSRLGNAAANGSIIAKDIMGQIASNQDVEEMIRGSANYFSTKKVKQSDNLRTKIKVLFTVFNKDIYNENFPDRKNPKAVWFPENRTELDPAKFVKCFKQLPEYSDEDMEYFANVITIDNKVTVKLCSRMEDFMAAYLNSNYSNIVQYGESTLHNSCMRYAETARNAADFYSNFASAKIIVAYDAGHNILGRAVVWENAVTTVNDEQVMFSFLDRVYYTHNFVMKLIYKFAEKAGINLRKQFNDYEHPRQFMIMNPLLGIDKEKNMCVSLNVRVKVYVKKAYKHGAPYMDTLYSVSINTNGELELSNYNNDSCVAECHNSSGFADRANTICPKCGAVHNHILEDGTNPAFCSDCYSTLIVNTPYGKVMSGKTKSYKDSVYPANLFENGRPVPSFRKHLLCQNLYK